MTPNIMFLGAPKEDFSKFRKMKLAKTVVHQSEFDTQLDCRKQITNY